MTNFPSAKSRVPDLYNLIIINKEIAALEEDILDARYIGLREIVTNDTMFTDTTANPDILLDTSITGTVTVATVTESAILPGKVFKYNSSDVTFAVVLDGTKLYANVDTVIATPTSAGNLVLGSSTIALTTTMTLRDVVTEINKETATSGIVAVAKVNDAGTYYLQLQKSAVVDGNDIIVAAGSLASILTDLGLVLGTYVININDVANQLGDDATAIGSGPYQIQLAQANGLNIMEGTALTDLGFTITVDIASDQIYLPSHGLTTGDQISFASPGTLPRPINVFPDSFYYAIIIDVDNVKIASTRLNATTGLAVDLTSVGIDYFTLKITTDSSIYFQVVNGYSDNPVYKQRVDEVEEYFDDRGYQIYTPTNDNTTNTFNWIIKW